MPGHGLLGVKKAFDPSETGIDGRFIGSFAMEKPADNAAEPLARPIRPQILLPSFLLSGPVN